MKQKLQLILCLLVAAAIVCCGCSSAPAETEAPKLTAGEVAAKMHEAVNAAPCTRLLTETSFAITLDAGELGMGVEVKDCVTTVTYLSYESQTPAALPEGAAEKAEIWTRLLAGECDNGDGTFTIREGMALADIRHPEGFTPKEKDYDHVTFRRDDYREITYTMSYITGEETPGSYFLRINSSSEKRWNENGSKVERQQMTLTTDTLEFTCDILGTTWGSREEANIYAWAPLMQDAEGIYYLYIEISDGYNDGMGFSKSADLTPEEMMEYLSAAASSSLIAD